MSQLNEMNLLLRTWPQTLIALHLTIAPYFQGNWPTSQGIQQTFGQTYFFLSEACGSCTKKVMNMILRKIQLFVGDARLGDLIARVWSRRVQGIQLHTMYLHATFFMDLPSSWTSVAQAYLSLCTSKLMGRNTHLAPLKTLGVLEGCIFYDQEVVVWHYWQRLGGCSRQTG